MNSREIFELFNAIDEPDRMLVIDAAAVGCFLFMQGYEAAGMKLLHTAVTTAFIDPVAVQVLLEEPKKAFDSLAMHAEIRALVNHFSG